MIRKTGFIWAPLGPFGHPFSTYLDFRAQTLSNGPRDVFLYVFFGGKVGATFLKQEQKEMTRKEQKIKEMPR